MPIKPHKGEEKNDFMERCLHELKVAEHSHEQSLAICLTEWRGAKEEGLTLLGELKAVVYGRIDEALFGRMIDIITRGVVDYVGLISKNVKPGELPFRVTIFDKKDLEPLGHVDIPPEKLKGDELTEEGVKEVKQWMLDAFSMYGRLFKEEDITIEHK